MDQLGRNIHQQADETQRPDGGRDAAKGAEGGGHRNAH